MRFRQKPGRAKSPSQGPRGKPDSQRSELGALLERQRVELEGHVADAESRALRAQEEANDRVAEIQRRSEERIQAEAQAAGERVAQAERLLKEAEERAVHAEAQLKKDGLRRRARHKLSEARQALEQERETGRRLSQERERLEGQLRSAQEQENELRQAHAAERSKVEGRVKELESQVRELEATLEKERDALARRAEEWDRLLEEAGAEHAREHNYRRALEDRLAAELRRGEEIRTQLDTEVAVVTAERQRVQQLEQELRQVRQQTSTDSVARRELEQRLETVLQVGANARPGGEQRLSEPEQQPPEAAEGGPAAERSPDKRSPAVEPAGSVPADVPANDAPTPKSRHNGQPSGPTPQAGKEQGEEGARRSRRWWQRPSRPCAVCQRPRPSLRDPELTASGWTLKGANALCASCQEEGWHFPADVAVPFRRVDAGSHS